MKTTCAPYQGAKAILTVHHAEAWYNSVRKAIYERHSNYAVDLLNNSIIIYFVIFVFFVSTMRQTTVDCLGDMRLAQDMEDVVLDNPWTHFI